MRERKARAYISRVHAPGAIRVCGPTSDGIVGHRAETRSDYLAISIGQTFTAHSEHLNPAEAVRLRDAINDYLGIIGWPSGADLITEARAIDDEMDGDPLDIGT
jgi:hypothetical protein